jgi:HEAT repeat protein
LQRRSGALTARGLGVLVRQAAEGGRLLLLLDGWDELGVAQRPSINEWLGQLLADYPNVRVIMAGSGRGYGPLQELGFVTSGIVPWRSGAAETLGARHEVGSHFSGHVPFTAYWRPGDTPFETHVRLQLVLAEKLQGAASSQFRLVELMEQALRLALPSPLADNQPAWLSPASRDLWQQLAYQLLLAELPAMAQAELASVMDGVLEAYGVKGELRAAHLLANTLEASPLFIRWSSGTVGFLNPLWRDYLAACYLAQMGDEGQIQSQRNDPAWQNALSFYVGRVGAGTLADLVTAGESGQSEESLFQVASWMSEAPDGGEWRRQVMLGLGRLVVDGDRPTAMRQRAAIAMAQTGENGVLIFLRQLLRQPDVTMRQVALAALMRLSPEVAIDLIERAWSDGDARIRWAAVHALGWTSDPVAERPLLAALLEPDEPIYRAAAEGLALNATETAYEILREAAAEDALSVRRAAVYGLALLDLDWAVTLLEEIAHDDSQWIVKSTATMALEAVAARSEPRPWHAVVAGNQSWVIDWALSQGRAVPIGKAAIPVLQEALRTTDTKVRVAAARTLGQLMAAEATESLQMALRDPAAEVRSASYEALWRLRSAWPDRAGATAGDEVFTRDPAQASVPVPA